MRFLQSMKVGQRLMLGFGLLVVLLALSLSLAIYQSNSMKKSVSAIIEVNNAKTLLLSQMRENNMKVERYTRDMLLAGQAQQAETMQRITEARSQYNSAWERLNKLSTDADGMAARKRILDAQQAGRAINNRILELALNGDIDTARQLLFGEARPLMQARADAIQANIAMQQRANEVGIADISSSVTTANRMLMIFGTLAALLGIGSAFGITRSLTQPLQQATTAAKDIAVGKLEGAPLQGGRDETGELLRAMQQMRETLQQFANEQIELGKRHDAGQIDHRLPETQFQGTYAQMAGNVNAVVASHLDVQRRMAEIVAAYAIGDFRADMDRLPGQKAKITEAMDETKLNLGKMKDDILRLSEAAGRGDFTPRGDQSQYQYAYREMVTALNTLMEQAGTSLSDVGQVIAAIASGDLTQRAEGRYEGAFGRLANDANTTSEQLSQIVGGIHQATAAINSAASEIATGNDDLSRRTEQQAASLEETAASMEELTSTVKQNAEHARQANQLAVGAADVASKGGDVVGQVVTTMKEIEDSSKKIANIISVIDGIAFQTNILALNAAVEAARAGEQGRGFAVVASEVRTLAQRSAGAAKEIKSLIDDSVSKVADGSKLVNTAGQTMGEIVTQVQRVTDIMSEISAASQEQSAGIEQVNQTVTQMDEATQQNAALVEEATAAARSMEEQAEQLAQAVSLFRIADQTTANAKARPSAIVRTLPVKKAAAPVPKAKPVARAAAKLVAQAEADWAEF